MAKGTVLGVAIGALAGGLIIKGTQGNNNIFRYSLVDQSGTPQAGTLALKKERLAFVIRDKGWDAWSSIAPLPQGNFGGVLPAEYQIVGVLSSIPVSQERIDYWKTLVGGTWVV